MLYFDSTNRKPVSSRLFADDSPRSVKTSQSLSDILVKKQLDIISFSDYSSINENLIEAAKNIGKRFKETEEFFAFLRKVGIESDHEGIYQLQETLILHDNPTLNLCCDLKNIGAFTTFNIVPGTNKVYVKLNVNALNFINKIWVQLYIASVIKSKINPEQLWLDIKLKNMYNDSHFVADVMYLKDGGMYTVFTNLNPALLENQSIIDRLAKNIGRLKRNSTVVCATNINYVTLKTSLAVKMNPDTEFFSVIPITKFYDFCK